ncbi:MAG: SRPBCC family protein [Pyrinomonadaceae bacterium]
MNIDRDAPVITQDEIVIAAPVEAVWGRLTDIDTWTEWNPEIASAKLDDPLAVGSVFRWTTVGMDIASTIGELVPHQRIAWSGLAQGIMGIHVWNFTAVDGGTLVQTEESWEGKPVRIQINLLQSALNESIRTWLENLKSVAETTGDAVPEVRT